MPKRKLGTEQKIHNERAATTSETAQDTAIDNVSTSPVPSPVKKRKVKQETAVPSLAGRKELEKSPPTRRPRISEIKVEVEDDPGVKTEGPASRQGRTAKVKVKVEAESKSRGSQTESPRTKRKLKAQEVVKQEAVADENGAVEEKKVKRKRKTKEEKEAEAMPLAARTVGHKLYIGAHVSAAGGVHNAVANSVHIGANAFALFLKSQRKWANPPLADEHRLSFHDNCKHQSYDQTQHVVPHGSYLVNLAHTDPARTDQAYESYLDDLKRCERLGIKLYNIHPGNTVKNDRHDAIAHLANNINRAHEETESVITLLENMAAGGNVLGSTFEDLRDIIAQVTNKARIGVCIDTCHAFAGGYDLRTPAAFHATMDQFEETVGFRYLRALHINDSKAPFRSHRDLHANIGTGFLGLRAFHNIVNDPRFAGLPLVLETPIDVRDENGVLVKDERGKDQEDKAIWATEIKMLESLVGMDADGEEFRRLERELARKGEPERKRLGDQMQRKKEKEAKQAAKAKAGKGRMKQEKKGEESESGSELSELGDDDQ